MSAPATEPLAEPLADVLSRALDALGALGLLGEEIEDEWTYVTDLADAQRARLETVRDRRDGESLTGDRVAAIGLAIDEIGAITDPHKGIDWLSTFPDLVALALGEPVGGTDADAGGPVEAPPFGRRD